MLKQRLLFMVACLAGCAIAQAQSGPAKIGASAVWQVSPQFIAALHSACDRSLESSDGKCLLEQMTKAGAAADAVSFTRELWKQSHGDFGIVTGFQNQGTLAFAWITYPLRANTNNGLLLVNGRPPIVNLEDLKQLDTKGMQESPQFQSLKVQFPKVDVWPGDRDGKTWPNSQPGPDGGTQFIVAYPLLNGCHACASAGTALFTWNFDAQGKFQGTSFIGMTPPPLQ